MAADGSSNAIPGGNGLALSQVGRLDPYSLYESRGRLEPFLFLPQQDLHRRFGRHVLGAVAVDMPWLAKSGRTGAGILGLRANRIELGEGSGFAGQLGLVIFDFD